MSESEAVVMRIDGDTAVVEVAALPSACGKCGERGGCGKPQSGPRCYAVPNTVGAHPGDRVVVCVADGAVLKAAALSYLMPLAFVFGGALAGAQYGAEGLFPVLGAAVGLAAGMVVLKLVNRRLARREPILALRLKSRVFNIDKEA
jgi:sigma-E factor negative regulatory protein RseC